MSSVLPPSLGDAVEALRRGEVVAMPTDTVYGLGVDPSVTGAVGLLYELKSRPAHLPIAVLVDSVEQAREVADLDPLAERLASRFWPGGLTLVVRRRAGGDLDLGHEDGTVGVRLPGHDAPRLLARRVGPLAVTSANLHGADPPDTAAGVAALFPGVFVVDGGRAGGMASTVVRVVGGTLEVLREGAVSVAALRRVAAGP